MEPNFQIVVANVGRPRRETLNGRDFLVAPATLIVGDAVLNGSQGALLYPAAENERDPQAWNGMPLVAWHPVKVINGVRQHVSARNPEILNEWGLGHFYHANALESHVEGNLDGEAWFDVENVKAVDAKLVKRGVDPILPRLLGGQQIELSTGLFTKNKQADPGVRNAKGDPYTGIATNYRPDHVAILPDEVGACSVDHGCGVNNQAGVFRSVINAVAKVLGINSSLVRPEQSVENEPSDAIDSAKACQILKDGSVNGEPLTDDQRGMFGAACGQTTNRGDCCAGKQPDQMCKECRAAVTANAWTDADFEAVLNARTLNTWSDAAREAAAEARKAKSGGGSAVMGGKRAEAVAQSDAASKASKSAKDMSGHVDAATEHILASRKHAEIGNDSAATAHKKAAEEHMSAAADIKRRGQAGQTRNSRPWTDADFDAILNERMCWGHPCGSSGAASGDAMAASKEAIGTTSRSKHEAAAQAHLKAHAAHKAEFDKTGSDESRKKMDQHHKAAMYHQEQEATATRNSRPWTNADFEAVLNERTKQPTSNQEKRKMTLTKIQRDKMVRHLTTNCACKIKPAVLNEMDDDALEQTHNAHNLILVVNAAKGGKLGKVTVNADGEGEAVPGVPWVKLAGILGVEVDPRTDPIQFAAEMKDKLSGIVSKLAGDAPPPADEPTPGDAPTVSADPEPEPDEDDDMTGNRRAPQLTQEQREDLAFAANMKREHKIGLVRRLLEHVPLANRKARGDKLFKLSIAELEDRIADLPVENARQPQQPQIDWSLAGGSSPTLNQADQESDDQVVELMTNADEEYRQMILKAKTA